MKKVQMYAKKYWYAVAVVAFIIGVGSLSGAKDRATTVIKDPKNAVQA